MGSCTSKGGEKGTLEDKREPSSGLCKHSVIQSHWCCKLNRGTRCWAPESKCWQLIHHKNNGMTARAEFYHHFRLHICISCLPHKSKWQDYVQAILSQNKVKLKKKKQTNKQLGKWLKPLHIMPTCLKDRLCSLPPHLIFIPTA